MKRILFIVLSFCLAALVSAVEDEDSIERSEFTLNSTENTNTYLDCSNSTAEQNKQLVLNFMNDFFIEKNVSALDKYIDAGPQNYIQHNPHVGNGREALREAAKGWFSAGHFKMEIIRAGADADLVFVHIKCRAAVLGEKTRAGVDIFRVKDNKIREHWDVIQEVADKTANGNSMF